MDEVRKLKRGLKDISTLFAEKEEAAAIPRPAPRTLLPEVSIQLISLAHPRRASNVSLYRWMAGQTAQNGYSAGIVSLGPESRDEQFSLKEPFTHKRMDLTEFQKNCASALPQTAAETGSSVLFLDFPWQNAAVFEKAIGMLDKIIFWATPEMEDLSQIYKWIKWTSALNNRLECLLAYDGAEEAKGIYVFEKLSEMASKHVGVDLFWFGCHPVSGLPDEHVRQVDLEMLLAHTNPLTLGEKKALAWSVKAS